VCARGKKAHNSVANARPTGDCCCASVSDGGNTVVMEESIKHLNLRCKELWCVRALHKFTGAHRKISRIAHSMEQHSSRSRKLFFANYGDRGSARNSATFMMRNVKQMEFQFLLQIIYFLLLNNMHIF